MVKYYIKTQVNAYFQIAPEVFNQRQGLGVNPTHIYWCSTIIYQRNKATQFNSYNEALFWAQKLHIAYTLMSHGYNRRHHLTLIEEG